MILTPPSPLPIPVRTSLAGRLSTGGRWATLWCCLVRCKS